MQAKLGRLLRDSAVKPALNLVIKHLNNGELLTILNQAYAGIIEIHISFRIM